MTELEIATAAARAAGAVTEKYFRKSVETRDKWPDHPVTVADIEANQAIKEIIRAAFPDDGWLSEECVDSVDRLEKKRVWIIDPIDGTKEFIAGIPEYVISIGLAVDGLPVLGVIYQPTTDQLWTTSHVSPLTKSPASPPHIYVSRTEESKGLWKTHGDSFRRTPCGSIAYKITQTAIGAVDGAITVNPRSEWDIAAAHAIIRAAGGDVVTRDGEPILYNKKSPRTSMGVIAGSKNFIAIAKEILK